MEFFFIFQQWMGVKEDYKSLGFLVGDIRFIVTTKKDILGIFQRRRIVCC